MKKKPTSLRRSMFMRLGFNFYDVAVTIFCVAFGLLCFYPLWYCLVASVMPYEEYVKGGLMLWFKGIDLQYYIQIFSTKVYTNSLLVSAVKTVLATALSVLVTSAMAYAVSKVHIRGMKLINALVVFNLFFAGGLIPQYMLYKSLHLTGNFWVMVLPGTLNISYFIIMRNYFSFSVSRELEDAAMIDGCNPIQTYFKVVFPILRPTMVSVGILEAMWVWNDYLLPTLVLDIKKYRTIPMLIQYFRGSYGRVEMGPMMACIMLTVLPIIILYLACQKYIIEGVVAGAVKG